MGRFGSALVLGVIASLLLAGCVGLGGEGASDEVAPTAADGPQPEPERGAPALLGSASPLPTEPPADASRTLDAAPTYRIGEWWEIEIDYRLSGNSATLTRVVAGTQGEDYLVGMPAEAFSDEVIVEHLPPFGRIDRWTLDFDAHDRPLNFVDFPLEEGHAWETQWWGGTELDAEVVRVEGDEAEIHLARGSRVVRGVWDAQLGAFAEFESPGHLAYEVVDHGFAYEGDIVVPANRDIVFCHGRSTVVVPIEACHSTMASPAGPAETIGVSDAYDRVSYGILIFDSPSHEQAGTGVYRIAVTHPSGEQETVTKLPTQPGLVHEIGGDDEPAGAWQVKAQAGGAGAALLEGVGYQTYEVALSDP